MYSLGDYGGMIADPVRIGPYLQAIEAAVRPGSVVLDLGCGPALFSLVACRAGARRVYAVDLEEIVHFGRQFAAANHFTDRIDFLRGDSRQIQLPERADVIVSDLRGALPFYGPSLLVLEDARRRHLAAGGSMVPEKDTLFAAIVESGEFYRKITSPWCSAIRELDLSVALPYRLNEVHPFEVTREQLLAEPQAWWVIDYGGAPSTRASGTVRFQSARSATAHGIAIWFDTQLYGNIGFSSGPGTAKTVYGQTFLPFPQPIPMSTGQEVQVELHADLIGSDYVWRWETRTVEKETGVLHHFRQSTLQGAQFSPHWLRRHARDFVPVLSTEGEAERWLLQAMDGNTALEKIAKDAAARFSNVFCDEEEAFRRVSALAEKFSR